MQKKAQVGIEYMIVMGFVTFAIISILALAILYSDRIKDRIKLNQIESFAVQLLNSAESVFFAGEPSKTTVRLYLPEGVNNITVTTEYLIIETTISSGLNRQSFKSKVPLAGAVSSGQGIKKLSLQARDTDLLISE